MDDLFNISAFESTAVDNITTDNTPEPVVESPTTAISLTKDESTELLSHLEECFTQASELTSVLLEAKMATDVDTLQHLYTEEVIEEAICNAILESYENGPIFEKVDRKDKEKIKAIVKSIRPKIQKEMASRGMSFYQTSVVGRILLGVAGLAGAVGLGGIAGKALLAGGAKLAGGALASKIGLGAAKGLVTAGVGTNIATGAAAAAGGATALSHGFKGIGSAFKQIFETHAWQIIGVIHMEESQVVTISNQLTREYADELGEYKIIPLRAAHTIYDAFKTHFGWNDKRKAYFLIVDTALPEDMKDISTDKKDDEGYTDIVDK